MFVYGLLTFSFRNIILDFLKYIIFLKRNQNMSKKHHPENFINTTVWRPLHSGHKVYFLYILGTFGKEQQVCINSFYLYLKFYLFLFFYCTGSTLLCAGFL